MRTFTLATATILCAVLASPVWAKDNGHGNSGNSGSHGNSGKADDRGNGGNNSAKADDRGNGSAPQFVIVDNDRRAVSTYYRDEFSRGNCPPGLAKKDNGCLPPGQAKKMWVVGQPLPPHVVYYPLPPTLYSRLTPPPYGYEYVRVDDDVLLMQSASRSILNILVNLR